MPLLPATVTENHMFIFMGIIRSRLTVLNSAYHDRYEGRYGASETHAFYASLQIKL
jgi:hypothetical protein